ncbi:hypothetical protein BS028_08030 [Vibrio parahaemolyticus]|nr:hypothetical protein [Vibrio parahaemolyticus]
MNAYELNELTPKYLVESGHNRCHPETCTCWNFRVFEKTSNGSKGENVLNSDSSKEVKQFLYENDPQYKNND